MLHPMWNHIKEFPAYSRLFKELGAWVHFTKALISFRLAKRLVALTRAYSLAQSPFTIRLLSRALSNYLPPVLDTSSTNFEPLWEKHQIGWNRYRVQLDYSLAASRTLVLKAPRANGEKGVIVSCFEYNWLRILSGIEPFDDIDSQYTLVLSTTSSPTNYNVLALALEKIKGPVFVIPCNFKDINKLKKFHPRVYPLDFLACDWLNPAHFNPRPWKDREIDILMVANWAPVKRHWHFFKILKKLPANLRIVCIGQPDGTFTLEHIRKLQEKYGVQQDIEFLESIPIEKVNELQCQSKIAIVLSRREGCCVAAVEGLMADCFLAMMDGAYVGPVEYIIEETGICLRSSTAHAQIMELLNHSTQPASRQWAEAHISCHQTVGKLNHELRKASLNENLPWTIDISTPCWRPFPCFVDRLDEAALTPTANELTEAWPTVFPPNWIQNSRF